MKDEEGHVNTLQILHGHCQREENMMMGLSVSSADEESSLGLELIIASYSFEDDPSVYTRKRE